MLLAHLSAIGIIGDVVPPPPPPVVEPVRPSGGWPAQDYEGRTRKDVSKARKRVGLEDDLARQEREAAKVVADVAARQAKALQTDPQKQYEELSRQLELEGLKFQAAYLEALNQERVRLIDAEIARLLKKKLEDEELMIILMVAAAI